MVALCACVNDHKKQLLGWYDQDHQYLSPNLTILTYRLHLSFTSSLILPMYGSVQLYQICDKALFI
jgi:hypothetical protein